MNKLKYSLLLLPIIALLTVSSCTKNFEEFNTDPVGIEKNELKADFQHIGAYFPQIQQMVYCNYNWGWGVNWPFQIMQNLNADIYAGYMMTPTPFAGNVNNTTYALVDGWNASAWDYTYSYMMPAVKAVEDEAKVEYPQFYAVARIMKVLAISRLAAVYGPVIYTKYGASKTASEYDDEETAYKAFFADLKEAEGILKTYVAANPDARPFAKFDNFFAGDFNKWIRFSNSLRLRLAVRISGVAPDLAKTEAESAIASGVFAIGENAEIKATGYTHPVAAISGSWGDIAMNAVMESILGGYKDPRLPKFFLPAADKSVIDAGYTYKGIRQGIEIAEKGTYGGHSLLNLKPETPAVIMTAAEVYFLRAEVALKGWNAGGSAKELYEMGVRASFEQYTVSGLADYLASEAVAAPYTDLKNAANNLPAGSTSLNNVSPKWDDAATTELKLQKIITQKWIAMFPEGNEAWTEQRRTGYPVLFPVMKNDSQGKIDSSRGVRRLNFSVTEKNNNPTGYAKAVQYIGGSDSPTAKLWWDVK